MDLSFEYNACCGKYKTTKIPLKMIRSQDQRDVLKSFNVTDEEIDSWSISGICNQNDANGFYACIIETVPGEAGVGFCGSENMAVTENVKNDWVEADLGLLNSTCTNQQAAVDFENIENELANI